MRAGLLRDLAVDQRSRAILKDLSALRALTGAQLDALHFPLPSPTVAATVRRRVMGRLARDGVVVTLPRPVGGVRHGSRGHVYTLGYTGHRLLPQLGLTADYPARPIPPPSDRFLAHTLAVSGLYVALRQRERAGDLTLSRFVTEPACWHRTGYGDHLKPDAFTVVRRSRVRHLWWVEIDRATEHRPAVRRKLMAYITFALSGHGGPIGRTVPRVLLTAPNPMRHAQMTALVARLPHPAGDLIHVCREHDAAGTLARLLAAAPNPTDVGTAPGGPASTERGDNPS